MFESENIPLSKDNNNCYKDQKLLLRSYLKPGDIGWIVERHGILYYEQYGFDTSFEKLVMKITSDFFTNYDSEYEKFWIAEYKSKNVGFILLSRYSDSVAKLRLLFVEKEARGRGVGSQLIDNCVEFAKSKGYSKVLLWTVHVLEDAAKLYETKGFQLIEQEASSIFGLELTAQTYQLLL